MAYQEPNIQIDASAKVVHVTFSNGEANRTDISVRLPINWPDSTPYSQVKKKATEAALDAIRGLLAERDPSS